MSTQKDKADHFRSLHVPGSPLVLYNIWDAGSAKAVTTGGAKAIATGSWSVAAANGYADGEQIPIEFVIGNLKRIVAATELPVTIDLESGYGSDPDAVGQTIAAAIKAGAIGCNLEDSFPENGTLRDIADQAERIANARVAADASGIPFFINARTDVFLSSPLEKHESLLAIALERGRAFAKNGADGLFVPGLVDAALITRIVQDSPLPINVLINQRSPALSRLAELGVSRASYGPNPFIAAMELLERETWNAMQ